jgi:hypothetical protein
MGACLTVQQSAGSYQNVDECSFSHDFSIAFCCFLGKRKMWGGCNLFMTQDKGLKSGVMLATESHLCYNEQPRMPPGLAIPAILTVKDND